MQFSSRITTESTACPGVTFTLNKMTEGRRIKLRLTMAEKTAKLREIMVEVNRLREDPEPNQARVAELLDTVTETLEDEITPAWVKWGLHSITGLTIDGQEATPDLLIADGPRDLYKEIAAAIKSEAGLSEEAQGEFVPPITSGAQVTGGVTSTDATPAAE
jgi:hypothetical protein